MKYIAAPVSCPGIELSEYQIIPTEQILGMTAHFPLFTVADFDREVYVKVCRSPRDTEISSLSEPL